MRWSAPYRAEPRPWGNMLCGGSRNVTEMIRDPSAISLPVRMKKGTPAQRQLSISQHSAIIVSASP